jgi:hypothetical protein
MNKRLKKPNYYMDMPNSPIATQVEGPKHYYISSRPRKPFSARGIKSTKFNTRSYVPSQVIVVAPFTYKTSERKGIII